MTRKLAQQFVIVACALALLLAPFVATEQSLASSTNAFHWARKQSQFTIQAGNNVSGGWNSLLKTAIKQWNKSDVVTIKEVSGSTSGQACNERKGRIEVCSGRYGTQQGWLGLTRLFFDNRGTHVQAATVQMNDSYFEGNGQYNDQNARRHTICHEMGHAIGLDHVDTRSCMNNSQYAVFHYVKPINKDYRQLAKIYKHKDSTSTVAGKQKKDKKSKKKKDRKGKKNKDRKKQKREEKRAKRKAIKQRKRAARANGFFDPTALPSVPSGLVSDETVTIETLDDGRKVVSFITWADE